MEAYVAIGIKNSEPHSWVITRYIENSIIKIIFWESLEGKRYDSKVRFKLIFKGSKNLGHFLKNSLCLQLKLLLCKHLVG
jgi:hypothetical protein